MTGKNGSVRFISSDPLPDRPGNQSGARRSCATICQVYRQLKGFGEQQDVPELKRKIGKSLQSASSKILVIIDDIDRLPSSDVREVFRLVKSVGDFPNVTYLLALDREAVCRMLGSVQGGTGEEYLEKIVQIPFELTAPDRAALHQMLFKRLDAILAATPDTLFDKNR